MCVCVCVRCVCLGVCFGWPVDGRRRRMGLCVSKTDVREAANEKDAKIAYRLVRHELWVVMLASLCDDKTICQRDSCLNEADKRVCTLATGRDMKDEHPFTSTDTSVSSSRGAYTSHTHAAHTHVSTAKDFCSTA